VWPRDDQPECECGYQASNEEGRRAPLTAPRKIRKQNQQEQFHAGDCAKETCGPSDLLSTPEDPSPRDYPSGDPRLVRRAYVEIASGRHQQEGKHGHWPSPRQRRTPEANASVHGRRRDQPPRNEGFPNRQPGKGRHKHDLLWRVHVAEPWPRDVRKIQVAPVPERPRRFVPQHKVAVFPGRQRNPHDERRYESTDDEEQFDRDKRRTTMPIHADTDLVSTFKAIEVRSINRRVPGYAAARQRPAESYSPAWLRRSASAQTRTRPRASPSPPPAHRRTP